MLISEFDYDLPEDLIAQEPLEQRDASRMLVVDRGKGVWSDSDFRRFAEHLGPDDVVVVNNTRVIPARLVGKREESGGRVEIFLVRELDGLTWEALVRPGARLRQGSFVAFTDRRLRAEILDEPGKELRLVHFHCDGPFNALLEEVGSTPLPPYIKRPSGASEKDRERYQTIYSKSQGAIAAPTAGLHFTSAVLAEITKRSHVAEISLHVGYGTFEPVRVEEIKDHVVSAERYEISEGAAHTINLARANGGRVIAVGTTTLRALEYAANNQGEVVAGAGHAQLTILPGYQFRVVKSLLTNFHLPRSSLLLLVSAFAGQSLVLEAYRHAVREGYRFYSYGDCMLIL